MNNDNTEKKDINPADLPQSEVFTEKEIFQHPQPADWGKPLNSADDQKTKGTVGHKEYEKTKQEEGLNEEKSAGEAGAFEGFEDQEKGI